ncbi:MAG: helix-turn-helix domain-containing protein [Thiotrichaceae bacterium]|nr:helix-turn-helix domain-containing protein [Thiotrichaceae bacterium]
MDIGKKMNLVRTLRGWSQEEMAEKLNMSVTGYAKIERGETKLHIPRLEKIADVLGIELKDLFEDEKNNFSFHDRSIQYYQSHINSAIELTQELEKMHLLVEKKDSEIALLTQQIEDLRMMLGLLNKQQA